MDAFRQFYTDQGDRLFGYLLRRSGNRAVAADLVQETFTRYLERYRDRPLSAPLLYTMARHLHADHVRRQRRQVDLAEATEATSTDDGEHLAIAREESRRVLAALQQLDEDDRDLLAMVAVSGLSYRDIAAVCACSEGSVKVRVHRARQKLRQLLPAESP